MYLFFIWNWDVLSVLLWNINLNFITYSRFYIHSFRPIVWINVHLYWHDCGLQCRPEEPRLNCRRKKKKAIDETLGNFSPKLESDSSINKAAKLHLCHTWRMTERLYHPTVIYQLREHSFIQKLIGEESKSLVLVTTSYKTPWITAASQQSPKHGYTVCLLTRTEVNWTCAEGGKLYSESTASMACSYLSPANHWHNIFMFKMLQDISEWMNQKTFSGKAISTLTQSQWEFHHGQYSSASESKWRDFLSERAPFLNKATSSQTFCEYSYNNHD